MSGSVQQATGLEMDAIASSVIGGTLLTGGVGNVIGSFFGRAHQRHHLQHRSDQRTDWPAPGPTSAPPALLCFFIVLQSVFALIKAENEVTSHSLDLALAPADQSRGGDPLRERKRNATRVSRHRSGRYPVPQDGPWHRARLHQYQGGADCNRNHSLIASGSHGWENRLENGVWTYSLEDVWAGLQDAYAKLAAEVLGAAVRR